MKSPEEIKKGLECCNTFNVCHKCPYEKAVDTEHGWGCVVIRNADALAYIQQLERERDAAVALMREFAARINAGEDVPACEYCAKEFGKCNCNCLKEFELRGVREVE